MNKYSVLAQKGKTNMNYCDIQDNCKILRDTATQYDQIVKQNQSLQTQLRTYEQTLFDIQTIAGKSKNYSSTATKIFDKCSEVLCQANGVQTANKS